jgi:hypothetical protein
MEKHKIPDVDEMVSYLINGFKMKPWIVDDWKKSGKPLKDSFEYQVELADALTFFKINKDSFTGDEHEEILSRVTEGIQKVTRKISGLFLQY